MVDISASHFQQDGTVQLFGTKGQKFHHCLGTKGQQDKLKILPREGMGRGSQNSGRDRLKQPKCRKGLAGTAKIRDRTEQKRTL